MLTECRLWQCAACARYARRAGEAASPDEVIDGLRTANARLRELLAGRDAHIAHLLAQVAQLDELQALVAESRAQIADLAARVKQNSKNSSKLPSSDGLARPAPKSLRKKAGRRPGRPKGQPGATMELTGNPDHVIRHEPSACHKCGTGLAGARPLTAGHPGRSFPLDCSRPSSLFTAGAVRPGAPKARP